MLNEKVEMFLPADFKLSRNEETSSIIVPYMFITTCLLANELLNKNLPIDKANRMKDCCISELLQQYVSFCLIKQTGTDAAQNFIKILQECQILN